MSAFVVSQETTASLADYIAALCNMGYNFFGYEAPEDLKTVLREDCTRGPFDKSISAEKVYFKLREMNVSAVVARYKKYEYPWAPDVYEPRPIHAHTKYDTGIFLIEPWHYDMLKKLDCYLYQCTEGNIPETALYKALDYVRIILAGHIARNNHYYRESRWG